MSKIVKGKRGRPRKEGSVKKEPKRRLKKTYLVRTSCGVFFGQIKKLDVKNQTCLMSNARRIWYWSGANSISELIVNGVQKADECKFPVPVDEILLFDVKEVAKLTPEATKSLNDVPVWEFKNGN